MSRTAPPQPLLSVRHVSKRFGGVVAVDDVSLTVDAGEAVGLIGPNGAGKSTLFSMLAGQIRPAAGTISFAGERVDRLPAHAVFARGLARTFQIPRPFRRQSVLDNLLVAAPRHSGERLWPALVRRRAVAREVAAEAERARTILTELGLADCAEARAAELSGGQHKLLELARALMVEPRAILLDEPCAGVNPVLIDALAAAIERLRARGITLVIVEHNIDFVMRHCNRVLVMAQGRMLIDGPPAEVRADPRVLDAFLGNANA